MENYDMRTMFTLNMEGLHLRLFQFQTLLAQLCPQLDQHLSNHNIHAQMYGSPWFLTLFAYSFPISLVLRIYDLVFAEGAVETITRVAIAVMQKNEAALLEINEFENLMLYLGSRKLYEEGYASDPEAVIRDTMALSTIITRQKMESISENYHKEAEQEKNRAHQLVALRFGGWGRTSSKKSPSSKRDSWFPWSGEASATTATATETTISEHPDSSLPATIPLSQDPTVSVLHEQIEDLVTALSQLQKDHTQLSEQMMTKQMSEMDLMNERNILLKKNRMLEKQITQHAAEGNTIQQPSPVESEDGDPMHERLASLQKEEEFRGFVDALKLSGDFGALIAGALSGGNDLSQEVTVPAYNGDTKPLDTVSSKSIEPMDDSTMNDITSELVNIKLANFEMGLKYQTLCQDYEMMKQSLKNTQEGQGALLTKMMTLQTTIESLQIDKERLLQEKDELLEHHEELNQKALASKKTCADIQLEKLGLDKENERLCHRVKELEDQRTEYLMPRGSFTEEVFAAHQTLFGNEAPAMSRRHTVQMIPKEEDVYQSKYIESDLRCRELEKLLAEAKFKLVEYEATSPTSSPRVSLQQNKRPTSLQTKRSSTLSVFSKNPTSPTQDQQQFARESTDSLRSTNSASSSHQKRSSVYSRFLNVLGSGSTPLPEETNEDKLTDEEHA
jgi:hypothetical protein